MDRHRSESLRAWLILALIPAAGCASPTHTVDSYPGSTDSQNKTGAYQAQDGGIAPATRTDAAASVGAAVIDTALGLGSKSASGATSASLIQGHCEVVDGEAEAPCAFIGLILKDSDGAEAAHTRTDGAGNFAFRVSGDKDFLVVPSGTRFLAEASPAGPVRRGASVHLTLRSHD